MRGPARRRGAIAAPSAGCTGAITAAHDPDGPVATYRPGVRMSVVWCGPCADAAARFGMIERRAVPR